MKLKERMRKKVKATRTKKEFLISNVRTSFRFFIVFMDIREDWKEIFVCVWVKEFLLASLETRFCVFLLPSGDAF